MYKKTKALKLWFQKIHSGVEHLSKLFCSGPFLYAELGRPALSGLSQNHACSSTPQKFPCRITLWWWRRSQWLRHPPFAARGGKMVELPGIEPGSPDREAKAATCLACHLFSPCGLRQTGSRKTSRLKFRPYPAGGVRTILPALRPCGPKARHHRNTQNCPGHGLVRLAD